MTHPPARLKVLCVDDEPNVLDGLALHLRRGYEVVTATSGKAGLEELQRQPDIAVVLSDMRMPVMDGAAFLAQARVVAPTAVRLLLTGQTDIKSAIAAVNEGQIFRFLTKPCPPPTLLASVEGAAEQHRLITAERVLLEQTLHGSVKAMTDILALASPAMFGRALQVKRHTASLCEYLGITDRWQIEVAALFSQLGLITLPPEVVDKMYRGEALSADEQRMASRVPRVTEELLAPIPRLEGVRDILSAYARPLQPDAPGKADPVRRAAALLRTAVDFNLAEGQQHTPEHAVAIMRGRDAIYDPAMLDALDAVVHASGTHQVIREMPLSALKAGMVFADDVMLTTGTMLVARGYEVTERFVERAANFSRGTVREPVRVVLRAGAE